MLRPKYLKYLDHRHSENLVRTYVKMERVYLDHYTGNPAAHLYLNLGFQYEGVLRKNCRKNGVLYDVHLMSMLAEEYFEKYGKSI